MCFGRRMESERNGRRTDGQAIKLGVRPWESYLTVAATSELSFYFSISHKYSAQCDLVNFVSSVG